MRVEIKKQMFRFKRPSGTSRGVLTQKESWFIRIIHNQKIGIGECSLIEGLSIDAKPHFEKQLRQFAQDFSFDQKLSNLNEWPSIQMGFETALLSLKAPQWWELYPTAFSKGKASIPINGLVWMGTREFMKDQIKELLDKGFRCLKLKIGALNFEEELNILRYIRKDFSERNLTIRLDANGAFSIVNALHKLQELSAFDIHSIEQPIPPLQWEEMASLCEQSPIDIALDEELIGVFDHQKREAMLDQIKPQFIILKPSLIGGFQVAEKWISRAKERKIGWWITSALESNIGLNAIAQWTYRLKAKGQQGLGTGSLFSNNIDLPLNVSDGFLSIDENKPWQFNF